MVLYGNCIVLKGFYMCVCGEGISILGQNLDIVLCVFPAHTQTNSNAVLKGL